MANNLLSDIYDEVSLKDSEEDNISESNNGSTLNWKEYIKYKYNRIKRFINQNRLKILCFLGGISLVVVIIIII